MGRKIVRTAYLSQLDQIRYEDRARILIVYGRRRVGKTTLLEDAFAERRLLKFEGVEGQSAQYQKKLILDTLADASNNRALSKVSASESSWIDVLRFIAEVVAAGEHTIYFEEVQWIANYDDEFVAALKYCWDNYFQKNPKLILILCGSSPSFMVKKVLKSKSLYNRAQHELHVEQFSLHEMYEFLGERRNIKEIFDARLSVGGIPEYLNYLTSHSSVYLSLLHNSFRKGAFFATEYERIFVSSLAQKPEYRAVVEFLSKRAHATRDDIAAAISVKKGGGLSEVLRDLDLCGFIAAYRPLGSTPNGKLVRYTIADNYAQFYARFVAPLRVRIDSGEFDRHPERALPLPDYEQWLGLSFERFCRRYPHLIARVLGFDGIEYQSGALFNRSSDPGFQIDLAFNRADKVLSLCEIKFGSSPITKQDATRALKRFEQATEIQGRPRTQRVLITAADVSSDVSSGPYFDRIIRLNEIFDAERYF